MASNPSTPFHIVDWPRIDSKQADIIVGMVCSLLSPIGRHRAAHILPSTGKRSKKRKRKQAKHASTATPAPPGPTPPWPLISSSLTIGLNSTTRHLQSLAAHSLPPALLPRPSLPSTPNPPQHLAFILLPQPPKDKPPDPRYALLPLLCHTASLAHAGRPATRLIPIGAAAEAKLAAALGLPRVGVLGVMEEAPGSGAAVDYVREHVGAMHAPWTRGGRG